MREGQVIKRSEWWGSREWIAARDALLLRSFRGNRDAVDCILELSTVTEIWDDLVDRDKPVDEAEVNRAFVTALTTLPRNPVWREHCLFLLPAVLLGINAWLDANELERDPEERYRMLAFYARNYVAEVVHAVAFCVLGFAGMREVSLELRRFMAHESFAEWEHAHAPQA